MESLRPLLTTYAYNIVGSYDDAKDIVQEAFLKFIDTNGEKIENKKAYLVRTVINLAINFKKRQKRMLAEYPGAWLPEPITTERADTAINRKEILSYSLMVLLEKLNAKQRAVFILKEAFGYDHEEIAEVLGISAENSRKILSRAKEQLKKEDAATQEKIPPDYLDKYVDVIYNGDINKLEKLLNDEIVIVSDGGGKVPAFMKPVRGKTSAIKLLLGIYKKYYKHVRIERSAINHEPALLYYHGDDLINCQVFSLENGRIRNIYFIRNPDKLRWLQERLKSN
jgi:RNA polymerase sigma-70 factor (ECF subfamily)